MASLGPNNIVLGPEDGAAVGLPGMGVRFMVNSALSGGGFSMVEHPIPPKSLAAPLHTHTNEDEYSYVIRGEIGMQVGEQVITARPGDFIYKPRGVQHAFWNASEQAASMLEIISPAGFEHYFAEMAPLLSRPGPPDVAATAALQAKYGLSMDFGSIDRYVEQYGLQRRS